AYFRFTYPKTEEAQVLLDAFDDGSKVTVDLKENRIYGYTTKNSGGVPDNFKNYFVLEFDRPFAEVSTFADSVLVKDIIEIESEHIAALVQFHIENDKEQVHLKVASSFISSKQADVNLKELDGYTFDEHVEKGENIWNK